MRCAERLPGEGSLSANNRLLRSSVRGLRGRLALSDRPSLPAAPCPGRAARPRCCQLPLKSLRQSSARPFVFDLPGDAVGLACQVLANLVRVLEAFDQRLAYCVHRYLNFEVSHLIKTRFPPRCRARSPHSFSAASRATSPSFEVVVTSGPHLPADEAANDRRQNLRRVACRGGGLNCLLIVNTLHRFPSARIASFNCGNGHCRHMNHVFVEYAAFLGCKGFEHLAQFERYV